MPEGSLALACGAGVALDDGLAVDAGAEVELDDWLALDATAGAEVDEEHAAKPPTSTTGAARATIWRMPAMKFLGS